MRPQREDQLPAETRGLVQDLCRLRERLLRMVNAVALSSELTGDVLEQTAEGDATHRDEWLSQARGLREDAALCREFASRFR